MKAAGAPNTSGADRAITRRSGAAVARNLGWKFTEVKDEDAEQKLTRLREEILNEFDAAANISSEKGPRGGKRWPPRYFIRRLAWHVIAHIWEIEESYKPCLWNR